jgi:hypothetical protein
LALLPFWLGMRSNEPWEETYTCDRNGDKGRDRRGNIGKRSENYENQAIGMENESRP